MFAKKLMLITVGLSIFLGIKFSRIYVLDDFENPFLYRFMYASVGFGYSVVSR